MGLIIRDGPMSKYQIRGQYLGTHRIEPIYIEKHGADDVNELWNWYIHSKSEGEALSLSDLDKARELIKSIENGEWNTNSLKLLLLPTGYKSGILLAMTFLLDWDLPFFRGDYLSRSKRKGSQEG